MKVSNIYYRALVFAAMVVILDLVVGRILNHYYFTQRAGEEFRATYAIEKSNADIVIIGASRANHQYHPEIFENRLQMTCYNAGRDGSSMFYYYGILKAITSRYSPKLIILDFSRDFEMKQNSYDRLAMLAPYYEKHPEIRPVVELKSRSIKCYPRSIRLTLTYLRSPNGTQISIYKITPIPKGILRFIVDGTGPLIVTPLFSITKLIP